MLRDELLKRFIRYVKVHTESKSGVGETPSTQGQFDLAGLLVAELKSIGMREVHMDKNAYVTATLPSTIDRQVPTIGFISHLDTSPDFSGKDVKPQVHQRYDGGDITLHAQRGIALRTRDFPELEQYVGQTLITTDGTTLLGADDKAGIAEIMSAMAYLCAHPELPHGVVKVAFTPDEEVGCGAHGFDVERFGADWAYTMDGGPLGELQYENFNAAHATVHIQGRSVHPGYAKSKMVNALRIAQRFAASLPSDEVPEETEGYEGFFHNHHFSGTVSHAALEYLVRDHDKVRFEARKALLLQLAADLDAEYGPDTVRVALRDEYRNMREQIEPVMQAVTLAEKAFEKAGVKARVLPIRGGTDGAILSHRGLPTPNIFAGGHNFHGPFEYIPLESMEKAVAVIINLVQLLPEIQASGGA